MERLLATLGDSQRLAILESLLASDRPMSQGELRLTLDVSDATKGTLSKNMKRLERAGLVARSGAYYVLRHRILTSNLLQIAANLARSLAEEEAHDAAERVGRLRRGSSPPVPSTHPSRLDADDERPTEIRTNLRARRTAMES